MSHTEPEAGKQQHWSHGAPVLRNGHYLLSTFGRYAISFLLGGLSAAFIVGGKTRDLSELLVWKGEVIAYMKEANNRFEKLDKDRWDIEQQSKDISDLKEKVKPIESMKGTIERIEAQ